MPEYVYALHDFLPEHEDEVSFHAGERIEVVEKDDLYGDGWWKGRNLLGKVGLFPVSYTAPAPPEETNLPIQSTSSTSSSPAEETISASGTTPSKSVLQPLPEESESESLPTPDIASPVPKQPPAAFLSVDGYESDLLARDDESLHLSSMPADGEVMKATMTDVQKAIEQLGRGASGGEDGDGARSFSFASTRDGGDTETDETDFDLSDVDGMPSGGKNGEDWHKNARTKLAAKARRAVAEAEKLEAMLAAGDPSATRRALAPPIEVELSDESEGEEENDFTRSSKFQSQRHHSYILEEDEPEEQESPPAHVKESSATTATQRSSAIEGQLIAPPRDESDVPTATANKLTFPVFSPPAPATAESPPAATAKDTAERPVSPKRNSYPAPMPPPLLAAVAVAVSVPSATTTTTTTPEQKRNSVPIREAPPMNGMPSPSPSSHFFNPVMNSKHDSMISSSSAPQMTTPAPMALQQQQQNRTSSSDLKKHPTEWSVEEVVEWLKSRGFDQDVCDKFTEQEITGDVLLELDPNLLKSEIGIMAFGKRMRISNAIADLRRPPSIEYSDIQASSSEQPSPMNFLHSNTHSRTQSQSHSHRSFPGTSTLIQTHSYSQSGQSSLGSPLGYMGNGFGFGNPNAGANVNVNGGHFEPVQETVTMRNGEIVAAAAPSAPEPSAAPAAIGLGIAVNDQTSPKRPANLVTSPSDGALKETAVKSSLAIPTADEEDRGHMSDGDTPAVKSMRRGFFSRSQDSTPSILATAKQSPLPSPSLHDTFEKDKESTKSTKEGKDKDKESVGSGTRHARGKKSVDGGRHERLSIFGGTFGGSLSKNRKPAPSAVDDISLEKTNKFTLPRLPGTSLRKGSSTSQRPSTPTRSPKDLSILASLDPAPRDKDTDKDAHKNVNTLRKRGTNSHNPTLIGSGSGSGSGATSENVNGASGIIKQGQNILEQIGEPDHSGWMRKKGERYNSWKLRYFILKGPHLYWLRSNNKNETRIKGYIHIVGYKVTVDENVDPGRYGFRIDHDHDKTHYFSSDEKSIVRDWMKAIMKATIGRDYTKPVVSSCNIPTIPLIVAQAMNPAPRPPSPTARDATQKALRREHPDQLSSRDARVLMGLSDADAKDEQQQQQQQRSRLDSFFSNEVTVPAQRNSIAESTSSPRRSMAPAPPRPSREMRRSASVRTTTTAAEDILIEWANSHLPENLQITDPSGPLCGGLALLRLAESIKGRPSSPPVPDSAFPVDNNDDKLDGLFRLFDFLLDNDVKMGSVSINDVRQGKRDKIVQLLRALKAWEDKRKALATTLSKGSMQAGAGFMVPVIS